MAGEGVRVGRAADVPAGSGRVFEAAGRLGPETALLLMHARGDERVPYAVSEQVHDSAREPKRLLLIPGGHHRSVQHDPELQAETLRFIARTAAASRR